MDCDRRGTVPAVQTHSNSERDRIGQYIGQVRAYKGISLEPLAKGLCSTAHLCRVENGERETDKILTDALLQRLGSPTELFWRLLDKDEFMQWQKRQKILSCLRMGDIATARADIGIYRADTTWEQQLMKIMEINLLSLQGAQAAELRDLALSALRLTQKDFKKHNIENILLSQTEGYLLLAYLEQEEHINGLEAVADDYRALLRLLRRSHYDIRERVYLYPYVVCHVVDAEYRSGNLRMALSLCDDAIAELSSERRLYAYDTLLEWKIRLLDASGLDSNDTQKLLEWLRVLLPNCPKHPKLLIPLIERGHVCCLNQVIRDRRELLGMSQEDLAAGICTPRTLSRIECWNNSPRMRVRRLLLQRLHMSGERYDYDIIPEQHDDYVLRSEIDRAHSTGEYGNEVKKLVELRHRLCQTDTNLQFLELRESDLRTIGPSGLGPQITLQEHIAMLKTSLRRTLPFDVEEIRTWPVSSLANNEVMLLLNIAHCYKVAGQPQIGLSIAQYVLRCLKNMNLGDVRCNEGLDILAYLQTLSCSGDCGYYDESDRLAWECIFQESHSNHIARTASILYNIAWNLEHRQNTGRQYILYLHKLAYAVTLLTDDNAGRRHIQKHCSELFDEKITL